MVISQHGRNARLGSASFLTNPTRDWSPTARMSRNARLGSASFLTDGSGVRIKTKIGGRNARLGSASFLTKRKEEMEITLKES